MVGANQTRKEVGEMTRQVTDSAQQNCEARVRTVNEKYYRPHQKTKDAAAIKPSLYSHPAWSPEGTQDRNRMPTI